MASAVRQLQRIAAEVVQFALAMYEWSSETEGKDGCNPLHGRDARADVSAAARHPTCIRSADNDVFSQPHAEVRFRLGAPGRAVAVWLLFSSIEGTRRDLVRRKSGTPDPEVLHRHSKRSLGGWAARQERRHVAHAAGHSNDRQPGDL